MIEVIVLYASISGRTRKVAESLVKEFAPIAAMASDLRDGFVGMVERKLFILVSPTYGVGEWHYLWEKWSVDFISSGGLSCAQAIAICALGDVKHHPASFAGAMTHLRDFVVGIDAKLVGETELDESYERELCIHLLTKGKLPGLVLDQVNQRQSGEQRIQKWVAQLKQEIAFIGPSAT